MSPSLSNTSNNSPVALSFVKSRAPLTSDDDTAGYTVGSHWTDQLSQRTWVCINSSTGNAVWVEAGTVPPSGGPEPPAIAGQGYQVVFQDDFNSIDGNIWRYQRFDKAEQPSKFSVANSVMTITNVAGDTSIDLMTKSGYAWQYGYIEGRMRYTANRASWASIWMMSDRHISLFPNAPCVTPGVVDDTKVCEFDMLESNHQFETSFGAQTYRSHFGTGHRNTGDGCSLADENFQTPYGFTFNYKNDIGMQTAGVWRTFAGLWTPTTLSWYCDDVLIKTCPPYASFDQPMRLFLAMYRHTAEGTATITTEVDWVKVWQQI